MRLCRALVFPLFTLKEYGCVLVHRSGAYLGYPLGMVDAATGVAEGRAEVSAHPYLSFYLRGQDGLCDLREVV